MKILLYLMLLNYLGDCAQPYFPRQITFVTDQEETLFSIDEINQRAYITWGEKSKRETGYALKHFPYALPDSPQSKSYVQLHYYPPPPAPGCHYGTYVGGDMGVPFTVFPLHWENDTLFEIKNYMDFQYEMIHSNNSNENEDYWYANKLCRVSTGRVYPCQEIYFKKNTEIPLRTTHIEQKIMSTAIEQIITNYKVLKIGEPDQKYFDSIPKNWSLTCADEMFQIKYDPKSTWLYVDQTLEIKVSLRAAPHRINGNDTLTIQWKASQYNDHFKLTPKQLYFNSQNYHEKQILKVTRIANGPDGYFIPIFHGGGFEPLLASNFAFTVFGTIG